jgi:starch-binding outer membrane protein, SusD/RagB family
MKKYFLSISFLLAVLAITTSSCEKQLETLPRQSIDASTALTSREAIEASITSIYANFKSARLYGRDLIAVAEALSDNGFATNKSGRLLPEAQNNQGATFTTTIWSTGYAGLNQINLTLAALPKIPGATAADTSSWAGQLYFLRALTFFEMMKAYAYMPGAVVSAQDKGGVPIVLTGIESAGAALTYLPARPSVDDVYKQIVNDFVLANNRLVATGTGVAASLASKPAAQAMLARAHLYAKNYTEAKRWADSAINSAGSRITTAATYVAGWRTENHPEGLFQIRFATAAENIGVNESLQTSYTTLVTPGNTTVTGGFGDLVPTLTLLTDLGITLTGGMTTTNFALPAVVGTRSTDIRNLMFEPGTSGRGNAKVECTKFIGRTGAINLDNVPVIRIAEVYLIRAEAQATAGSAVFNLTNALADLKAIKSRRYTDYTGSAQETADNAATQAVLYDEILRQRRIELAFEGQRFFDLKRLSRDLVKAPHYNTVAFTDTRILAPILQADVDGNPNLKQNAGY